MEQLSVERLAKVLDKASLGYVLAWLKGLYEAQKESLVKCDTNVVISEQAKAQQLNKQISDLTSIINYQ